MPSHSSTPTFGLKMSGPLPQGCIYFKIRLRSPELHTSCPFISLRYSNKLSVIRLQGGSESGCNFLFFFIENLEERREGRFMGVQAVT